MNYDQAINLIRKDIDNPGSVSIEDLNKAEEKAIAALMYCKLVREFPHLADKIAMPSDNED